ncbi:hypothetical protein T4D_6116 [Trichinella pseudospiralis]|uniref:Uncharacterized protein n=1 Tax=Trichinella pseudospiralis TaxID=6337 RepID=A0A0V1FCJ4_TRIPS|nr:hypothetical protein T4D_6116 [Trichinella pseudospiralis]
MTEMMMKSCLKSLIRLLSLMSIQFTTTQYPDYFGILFKEKRRQNFHVHTTLAKNLQDMNKN